MGLIFDIVFAIILLGCVSTNAKRGFVKSLALVLASVVALFVSVKISSENSQKVYDEFVKSKVEEKISQQIDSFDSVKFINENLFEKKLGVEVSDEELRKALLKEGEISQNLVELAKRKKETVDSDEILEYINKNSFFENSQLDIVGKFVTDENFDRCVRLLANENANARAKAFCSEIATPFLVKLTGWVMTLLLFLLISAVLKFVILRINILEKIPVAGFVNTILGGAVGAGEAVIVAIVCSILLKIMINLNLFGQGIIDDSVLFKLIYNLL